MSDLKQVPLTSLHPWKRNPRKIDQARLDNLKRSMQQDPDFLRLRPILALKDGTVYAGNQRLKAAKELGLSEVWAVLEDVDEDTMKARALRDNNQWGEWEPGELAAMLDEIPDDLKGLLGFADDELEDMKAEQLEVVEDTPPEPPKEAKSKLGDLYQLGEHRLLCGDATKIEDVERLMGGEKADMVFTDPPYGVSYQSNMREKTAKFDVLENDDVFITDWINLLPSFSEGFVFIWTAWKVLPQWVGFTKPLGEQSNLIIWDKGGGGMGDLTHAFATDFEIALVFNRGAEITGKRLGSVWSIGKDHAGGYQHPTQKPVGLAATAIQNVTRQDDSVLDLFGGSGSTLIACEQTKRKCYMMELDPRYIDVIVQRWENLTGQKATLLTHG